MEKSRRLLTVPASLLGLAAVVGLLGGCQGRTYRVWMEMPANNVAMADVHGNKPFVIVTNGGPGAVSVTWDHGSASAETERLHPGSVGKSLRHSKIVRVETGEDDGADVRIEAQRASGLGLNGPLPK